MRGLRSRRVTPALTCLLLLGQCQLLVAPWVLAAHPPSMQGHADWLRDHLPPPEDAAVSQALAEALATRPPSRTALVESFTEALTRSASPLSPAWQDALEALLAAARIEDQQRSMPGLNGQATLPRTYYSDALSPLLLPLTRPALEALLPSGGRQTPATSALRWLPAVLATTRPFLHVVSAAQPLGP